nr:efflux RND transporter periplasmic adaptor subunit [Dechloromonas sp.]
MKRLTSIFCALLLAAQPLFAHEGHDHGDEKQALPNLGNTPQRLPDGVVFLPKTAQRQMGVRTEPVVAAELAQTLELPGKVVMDPHLGGRVQAMIAGRIEAAGPHGLPSAGSRVKKGEVLAWVVPAAGQIERSNQAALLAELKAGRQLAEKRLNRLRELSDTVPRKEIEAAESELASLNGRIAAVGAGLSGREALVAPVAGILAASNALVGQVVEPKELIFEIVDPDSLHIEALAYEPLDVGQVAEAGIAIGDRSVPLNFIGASRRLREQALPLIFENHAIGAGLALPLGQPVKIQLRLKASVKGLPIPLKALTRNQANEIMVWVKVAPERFAPRVVRTMPFDGVRVIVAAGLAAGDRVVVEGAALINQIR